MSICSQLVSGRTGFENALLGDSSGKTVEVCVCARAHVYIIHVYQSVQFSHSVVSDSLQPHESQHTRPPCPSPTPGVYSNSCPSSWWYHPAISSSVIPFSSCPNPSQNQGIFQRVSSSHEVAKVLEFQLQHQSFQWTPRTDLFRMDWLDLLAVQGTLKSLLQHHSSKASIFQCSAYIHSHIFLNLALITLGIEKSLCKCEHWSLI